MRYQSRITVGSPAVRFAVTVTAGVILLLAVAGAVVGAATILPSPSPIPVRLAHNGLIAYGSNNQIWTIQQDGSNARQLTHSAGAWSSPIWSPDGTRIAAWHTENGVTQVELRWE